MPSVTENLSAQMADGFRPPSVEQVERLLERCQPQPPSKLTAWLPAGLLILLLMVVLQSPQSTGLVAAWMLLGIWLAYSMWTARRRLDLERRSARVQESAMLRRFPQALRETWSLLPQLRTRGDLHGRIVAAMGHSLEQVGAWDAALAAYDFLIRRVPADHPGARPIRMQRVFALLAVDRLADADDELRRLRDVADDPTPSMLSASLTLAQLWQMVATNHFDDAASLRERLVERLRPLGIDAGHGYALMAHAMRQLAWREPSPVEHDQAYRVDHPAPAAQADAQEFKQAQQEAQQEAATDAAIWWRRATLLLPPESLVDRMPFLASTAEALHASPRPNEMIEAGREAVSTGTVGAWASSEGQA